MIERRPLLVSAIAYAAITMLMGRHVIDAIGSSIAGDPGDPLLTVAILSWNATHVPWTDVWYQFPIFVPTRDALALSEHLLGVSLVAAPIQWLTGSPVFAYNLTVLLSYPLCGLAMYALVWRLTKSAPAAFLAGLAYAFAPYRASHLGHIQMLISFWMPIALLALHSYLESRRWPWLVVFAASWLMQGAANGYYLAYFTMVVGLWVAWFMVARGRWRDVGLVAAALAAAVVPLAPILLRYVATQRALGLSRNIGEITVFSADIAAPLCAPADLTFWGWLRVACAQEGELFAGAALIALLVIGAMWRRGAGMNTDQQIPGSRVRVLVLRAALVVAALYGAVTLWTLVNGPWRIDVPWRASASSADKPASVTLFLLLIALLLSRWFHSVIRRGSITTFYLLGALSCWLLAWGPFPRLFGEPVLYQAPYAWLLQLPGVMALRVPARLWTMVVLCGIVLLGLLVSRLLAARTTRTASIFTVIAACGLLADGWTTIRAADVPPPLTADLTGRTVLLLPVGDASKDRVAVYHAVAQRFRSINGYSGYEPQYYEALRTLSDAADDRLLVPFVRHGDVDVVVSSEHEGLRALLERQPGYQLLSDGPLVHYRVPSRNETPSRSEPAGVRVPVRQLDASCSPGHLALANDGDLETSWSCGLQTSDQSITADLGAAVTVGTVVHALGTQGTAFPRRLVIETSLDGEVWTTAWTGSPAAAVLEAAIAAPLEIRAAIRFPSRPARYLRLRQTGRHDLYYWSIAELEMWSGGDSSK